MTKMISFPTWLLQFFLNWQAEQKRRTNLNEFADFLGYSRPTISLWMNGSRSPSEETVKKLAEKVGPEIFDVMDLPRPDPDLQTLIHIWPHLSEEARRILREQGEQFSDENEKSTARSRAVEKTT